MKSLKYLFLAALTVLAFASCNKDNKGNEATNEGGEGGNGGNGGAAEFVPAATIDGDFDEWKSVTTELTLEGGPVYVFKATYDEKYIYFYIKRNLNEGLFPDASGNGYFYICLETDEDPTNGIVRTDDANAKELNGQWHVPASGIDSWFFAYLFEAGQKVKKTSEEVKLAGQSYPSDFMANIECAGKVSTALETIEIELRANREDMLVQTGKTVKIHTWGNKSATNFQNTPLTLKIEK